MGCGPETKTGRNWQIWRDYYAGGATEKALGEQYDISPGRVNQIRTRCDKDVRWALERQMHPANGPLPDSIRDGLLGVEFTFTMNDPWSVETGRKGWCELSDGSWFRFTIGASDE